MTARHHTAVLECFNGEILALAMDDNMKKELCVKTIEQMKEQYGKQLKGMIFHSDRGSQYTSEAFKAALKSCGITQSLSGVGHCFDNARMESFWATLKKEKIYRIAAYKLTREQVKSIVFRYVFVYYNRIRIYTSNPFDIAYISDLGDFSTAHILTFPFYLSIAIMSVFVIITFCAKSFIKNNNPFVGKWICVNENSCNDTYIELIIEQNGNKLFFDRDMISKSGIGSSHLQYESEISSDKSIYSDHVDGVYVLTNECLYEVFIKNSRINKYYKDTSL